LVPSSVSVPDVRAVARKSRFGRCVGRFGVSLIRSDGLNAVLRALIPMAEIDCRLAEIDHISGHMPVTEERYRPQRQCAAADSSANASAATYAGAME
jgi:hypothetical protein